MKHTEKRNWLQASEFRDSRWSVANPPPCHLSSPPLSSFSKRITPSRGKMTTDKLKSNFSPCSESQKKGVFLLVRFSKSLSLTLVGLACLKCLFLYQLLVPIPDWPTHVSTLTEFCQLLSNHLNWNKQNKQTNTWTNEFTVGHVMTGVEQKLEGGRHPSSKRESRADMHISIAFYTFLLQMRKLRAKEIRYLYLRFQTP